MSQKKVSVDDYPLWELRKAFIKLQQEIHKLNLQELAKLFREQRREITQLQRMLVRSHQTLLKAILNNIEPSEATLKALRKDIRRSTKSPFLPPLSHEK
jgi:hypothetical protein